MTSVGTEDPLLALGPDQGVAVEPHELLVWVVDLGRVRVHPDDRRRGSRPEPRRPSRVRAPLRPGHRGECVSDINQRVLSEYYPDGLLKRTTDRNGVGQSEYTYDANDNLTKA